MEEQDGMPPAYEDDWLRHLFEAKFATRHPTHSVLASSTMSDNKKQEKDFTSEVDALLPETASLAKVVRSLAEYFVRVDDSSRQESYKKHLTN